MKLITWNVNGLRAALKAGFSDFLTAHQPDILCLQEVKAEPTDVEPDLFKGWHVAWNPAEKKGYSGTVTLSREVPLSVTYGINHVDHDKEGRVITCEFADFYVVNCYTPNSQRSLTRLDYRMQWDAAFRQHIIQLDATKPVLVCGDLNVSHQEIDLANPKANRKNAGFTDEERASFGELLSLGLKDVFREQHPNQPGHYSWWTYRSDARARNIGWRLDYWLTSERLLPKMDKARILNDVFGSDHCPVEQRIS